LRVRRCQLSDGAFADAPVLTACRLPLFAIVFHRQSGVWQKAGRLSGEGRKPVLRHGPKIV
jgi:hypothetical protein